MKKYITLAALLAAGTACANAADYSFATEGWTLERNRTEGAATLFSISGDDNSMSLTNSNWSQSLAYIAAEGDLVSFSFDMIYQGNGSYTFSLIGDNISFVFGKNYDAGTYEYAKADGVSDDSKVAYIFKLADAQNKTAYVAGTNTNVNVTTGEVLNVSGVIDENNKLDLTVGTTVIDDIDLGLANGAAFKLNTIGFYGDGANNTSNVKFSNLKVSVIPEPSAFGLLAGVGALALVASRRRRK